MGSKRLTQKEVAYTSITMRSRRQLAELPRYYWRRSGTMFSITFFAFGLGWHFGVNPISNCGVLIGDIYPHPLRRKLRSN